MKWVVFILTIIFFLPFILAACSGNNEFSYVEAGEANMCGYCFQNLNKTVACNTNCTLDISYKNGTVLVSKLLMQTNVDGSYNYTYNFSAIKEDNNALTLSGDMFCGSKRESFEISLGGKPFSFGAGTSGYASFRGQLLEIRELNDTDTEIVEDLDKFIEAGSSIIPFISDKMKKILFIVLLIILFMYKEVLYVRNNIVLKK